MGFSLQCETYHFQRLAGLYSLFSKSAKSHSLFKIRWVEEVSLFDRVASPGQLHFQLLPANNRNFIQITTLT
jgi:hypothetical protein